MSSDTQTCSPIKCEHSTRSISFIERVPCELTIWSQKIKDNFARQELSLISISDYRTINQASNNVKIQSQEWIHEFGFEADYIRLLFPEQPVSVLEPFSYPMRPAVEAHLQSFLRFDNLTVPLFTKLYPEFPITADKYPLAIRKNIVYYKTLRLI